MSSDRVERSLEQLASSHSKWIDHLVDLVPAAFYRDQTEHVDLRNMSKEARAATKKAFKEQHKKAKREKLDPSATKSTSQKLKEPATEDAEDAGPNMAPVALNLADEKTSKSELQERLRQRLETMRGQREEKEGKKDRKKKDKGQEKKKKEKEGKGLDPKQAQQRVQEAKAWREKAAKKGEQPPPQGKRKAPEAEAAEEPAAKKARAEPELHLQFPKIDLEGPQLQRFTGKGAREAAADRKQKQHAKATLMSKLEGGERKEGGDGEDGGSKERLAAALARARGEKVLDDPKLLRKALKREGREKAKSAQAWQQRKESEEEKKKARQDKRSTNLKARKDKKLKTKIEKREKKLLRPGFEGRKTGFINAGGK